MTTKDIENLIAKFYNGETTVAEEKQLQKYFAETKDIPSNLLADKALFEAMSFDDEAVDVPENLIEEIAAKIDAQNESKTAKILRPNFVRRNLFGVIASAACVAFLVGIMFFNKTTNTDEPLFIANNNMTQQQALALTSKALEKASNNISKNMKPLSDANRNIEKAINPLQQTDERIQSINEKLNKITTKK